MNEPINTNLIDEEEYKAHFENFVHISQLAINTSKLGDNRIVTSDFKILFACTFFIRLCTASESIRLLCTAENYSDYNSVFSLSRNIIDCSHMLFYACFDDIPDYEREFRLLGLILYDLNERAKLLNLWSKGFENVTDILMFNVIRHSYALHGLDDQLEVFNKKISLNKRFLSMDEEAQKSVLRGAHHFIKSSPEKLDSAMGIIDNYCYKALYKVLSSSVHSFPITNNLFGLFGCGVETVYERSFIAYSIYHCTDYLKFSIKNMIEKIYFEFKDRFNKPEIEELETILKEVKENHRDTQKDI